MSIMKTLTVNGVTFQVASSVPTSSVVLLAKDWVGDGDRYYQLIAVPGATAHSKVDLQPTPEQLEEFHYKTLGFTTENEGGVVTAFAIGDKPRGDHVIQVTLTEVAGDGRIRGNTVGTTMPRSDIDQTDPNKADYVKGREKLVRTINGLTPDEKGNVTIDLPEGGDLPSKEELVQAVIDALPVYDGSVTKGVL